MDFNYSPLEFGPLLGTYWRRQWHPTPVLLTGKSHGRRSLVGCSPWGRWGLDTTELLHFYLSLSCIGEGNGNPLQYSCLENPRDGGAWLAAVCGVAQSWTWLKWPSIAWEEKILYLESFLINDQVKFINSPQKSHDFLLICRFEVSNKRLSVPNTQRA